MEKIVRYGLYIGVTLLLFFVFQQQCAYDFFYAEQLRSFLFSEAYAQQVLAQPGGTLEYVASFLVQFYVYDYVGPLVTSVLFFLIVWLCDKWLSKLNLASLSPVGSVLLGGLFIILEGGNVAYFAPDTLEIEDMEISFGQFIYWCLHGDTDTFYTDYRWEHWQEEVKSLGIDYGMSFYPYLWAEAESLEKRHRQAILMKDIIGLEMDFCQQIQK